MIPVIDIFAGAGDLGEGFSSMKGVGKPSEFEVVLSIEKEINAVKTLTIRSAFRIMSRNGKGQQYASWLNQKKDLSLESLEKQFPEIVQQARNTVFQHELGNGEDDNLNSRIENALAGQENWVLVGGPPCQAYSLIGRLKNRSLKGYAPESDPRFCLYKVYLDLLSKYKPSAFLLENVKGILSAQLEHKSVICSIMESLRNPGGKGVKYHLFPLVRSNVLIPGIYSPEDYIIRCEEFGVPQKRHRLIILGVRADIEVQPEQLVPAECQVTVQNMLSDLPLLRSHISKQTDNDERWIQLLTSALYQPWFSEVETAVQDKLRKTVDDIQNQSWKRAASVKTGVANNPECLKWIQKKGVAIQHETRSHMDSDLYRYLFVSCYASVHGISPKLKDFPEGLLPNHVNVRSGNFVDRFRTQVLDAPSTTITSHISKDGHYYIHPDPVQCRSLTVREAARLQTFPDNYFFSGDRTAQYHQVGNAVPPFLSKQIAQIIYKLCKQAEKAPGR